MANITLSSEGLGLHTPVLQVASRCKSIQTSSLSGIGAYMLPV